MNTMAVWYLIKNVLHILIFNPDHNMHNRLMHAVMDKMDVHDIKVEGDGEQDVRFFKHKVKTASVLP
jgi:hypothetical protein